MKRIKLKFSQKKNGSKEHFWHFLLGYLLPSIHYNCKNIPKWVKEGENDILLVFEDCGPIMNPLIKELATLFNIRHEIINTQIDNQAHPFDEIVNISRWDIRLGCSLDFSIYFAINNNYCSNISMRMIHLIKGLKWSIKNHILHFPLDLFGIKLKKEILFTRNLILNKLNSVEKPSNSAYLLLERSDEHSYYADNGKAERKGYGKSRRALLNLEEECNDLTKKGIPVNIYEPGSYSLLHQIKTFNNSKGVIGIKGAELANLIWLNPGSKVVVINFQFPDFHLYNYVSALDLKLIEKSSDTRYPDIKDYNIKNLLKV